MPLDPAKVGLAVQQGLSVVCATCAHFWAAQERRQETCAPPGNCAGPLAGLDFPQYRGPITDFSRWCFACGVNASHALKLSSGKVFGICKDHLRLIHSVHAVGLPDPHLSVLGPEQLQRKSLAAAIFEVETYYDKKAGG